MSAQPDLARPTPPDQQEKSRYWHERCVADLQKAAGRYRTAAVLPALLSLLLTYCRQVPEESVPAVAASLRATADMLEGKE